MTRDSKSQYRDHPSLKSRGNEKNRRSTGHPYEKIPPRDPTPTVVEEEELSPSTDDPEPEEAPLDVLQLMFELSTCSLLGLDRVCNDFGQFRLGEFSVRWYLAESIKKATTKAAATGNGVTFARDEAELQNKSLLKKQYPMMDILDDGEWMKVENNLEDWMRKGKVNIRIDLRFYYDRTDTIVIPPPGMAVKKIPKVKIYNEYDFPVMLGAKWNPTSIRRFG
jgi:hypothetical protein